MKGGVDRILGKPAEARDTKELSVVRALVHRLCDGKHDEERSPGAFPLQMTFRELAELWTDGELHRRYPDHVKAKRSALDDVWRLEKYAYGLIGTKALRDITLEDAERVMQGLNPKLAAASRRHVAQILHRVMAMAVYPCRVIKASPIPRGWLPSAGKKVAFPVLFPSEDAQLLRSPKVPLVYRVLYGVMHREGIRRGETERMTWSDLDLEHGVVRQDENKTDHPRWWKLGTGVTAALAAWQKLRGEVKPADQVFSPIDGPPVDFEHLADRVREHIAAAELTRPELFHGTAKRRHFTAHCLRHSFVTRSLANGKTDDWVRSRTGHRSNELLRYREVALSLTELELGEVLPLDEAIPELGVAQKVGQTPAKLAHPTKKRAENRNDSERVRERGLEPPHLAVPEPKSLRSERDAAGGENHWSRAARKGTNEHNGPRGEAEVGHDGSGALAALLPSAATQARLEGARALADAVVGCLSSGDHVGAGAAARGLVAFVDALSAPP